MDSINFNERVINGFIDKMQFALDVLAGSKSSAQSIIKLEKYDLSKFDDDYFQDIVAGVKDINSGVKLSKSICGSLMTMCKQAIWYAKQAEESIENSVNNSLPDASEVNIDNNTNQNSSNNNSASGYSSGGSSYNNWNYSSGISSGMGLSASSAVNYSNNYSDTTEKKVNEIDINSVLLNLLASFGVTVDKFGSVSKSNEYDYIVSLKSPNSDGGWKPNDIKQYCIKDNKVVGATLADGTFVKITDDGKLIINSNKAGVYQGIFLSGATTVSGCYASKSNFNSKQNKEIFKKFYPNATDSEFASFCESAQGISSEYSKVAQGVFENNQNQIVQLSEKLGYDSVVIENNSLKIDCTNLATELYAYESSKMGINYSDTMHNEIAFNDSVLNDLKDYLSANYNVSVVL